MPVYNKSVRDNIPKIIAADGNKTVTQEECLSAADKKLNEERTEYQKNKSLKEFANILKVIYANAAARGYSAKDALSSCGFVVGLIKEYYSKR